MSRPGSHPLLFRDFPTHVQLMLLAAQPALPAAEQSRLALLLSSGTGSPSNIDWTAFLALTAHHRVGPLVFQTLSTLAPHALPPDVRASLQRASTVNAFAALRAAAELRRLLEALAVADFRPIFIKGIALSQALYGSPNARHVGDLDLLTEPSDTLPLDLARQLTLLADLGYTRQHPDAALTPRRLSAFSHFWKDFTLDNPQTEFELDLHWRLFINRRHPANRLLETAVLTSMTVFGTPLRVFSLCDQFLYTAAHGVGESFTYLKSLADVAAFLRLFSPAQLDEALLRARDLGLLPQVSAAIHLSNAWMLTGPIEHPLLLPETHRLTRYVRRRTEHLLLRQAYLPTRTYPSPASWLALELNLVPGLRSLAEVFSRFLLRPRVWSAVSLPDRLFPLYALLGLLLPPRRHRSTEPDEAS